MRKLHALGAALALAALALAAPAQADTFAVCGSGHAGVSTTVTSCAFAENVRMSYLTQGPGLVSAYSPTTGSMYTMTCLTGFTAQIGYGPAVPSVRCTGGDSAVVWIF